MASPAGIGIYTSGVGVPDHVDGRSWRGVYNHYGGEPGALGRALVHWCAANGVGRVFESLLDVEAGWSDVTADEPLPDAPSVGPREVGSVVFVYLLDPEAQRIDAFATHTRGGGLRIGSVQFENDQPDVWFLDLFESERIEEARVLGPRLHAKTLQEMLGSLAPLTTERRRLGWGPVEEGEEGDLQVTLRQLEYEDGMLSSMVEARWFLVPSDSRDEPDRVRACLEAMTTVVSSQPQLLDVHWIESLEPLRRSGARAQASFIKIFQDHRDRFLG